MTLDIRAVTRDDVPAVVSLVEDTLGEFGIRFGVGSDTDEQVKELPASYHERGGLFLVAVLDGTVVGSAGVYPVSPTEAELRKMYLRPAVRGKGIGGQLLERCIAHAKALGARVLVLDTASTMTAAIALYEKAGFVRDDTYCRASRCNRGYRLDLPTGTHEAAP